MIVILIFAFIFGLIGAVLIYSERHSRLNARLVQGQVVGFTNKSKTKTKYGNFQSVVGFQHPQGDHFYVISSVGSSYPMHKIGQRVPVWVKTGEPIEAAIPTKITSIMGGIFLMMGIGMAIFFVNVFTWDFFSAGSSVILLAVIVQALWRARRKNKLTFEEFMKIKKMNRWAGRIFKDSEFSLIPFVEPVQIHVAMMSARKASMVSLAVCSLLALICTGLCWNFYSNTRSFLQTANQAQGRVIELVRTHSTKSVSYAPMIEFIPAGQSSPQKFKHSVSTNPPSFRVGEQVIVFYDPQNFSRAQIDSGIWNFRGSLVTGSLAALFLWLAALSFLGLDKYKPSTKRPNSHSYHPPKSA